MNDTMLVNTDPGAFAGLMLLTSILIGPFILGFLYLVYRLWPTPVTDDTQSLQLDTRVGCPNGICYLAMFEKRYQPLLLRQLGHFPTIIALASVAKSYRRKVKGTLTFIEDGVAHFEKDKKERLAWEVVDQVVGRLDWIGSREMRIISSQPPEGYRYSELFRRDHRNNIMHQLGPFPRLQAVVDINEEYRMEFIGVLWQKWTDKYVLEKELEMDVWAQLGKCKIAAGATID